jgi:AcrR family transcriptional regulator
MTSGGAARRGGTGGRRGSLEHGKAAASIAADLTPRQQELLDAALRVMSRKGYDAARTKEIAAEAGVSEATLFKHFPTKRHLLQALIQPFMREVVQPVLLASVKDLVQAQKGRPIDETLRKIAVDRFRLVRARLPLVSTLCLEAVRRPDIMQVVRVEVIAQIVEVLGSIYESARDRGEVRDMDRRLFIRSYMSLIIGYLVFGGFFPDELGAPGDEEAIEGIVEVFLHGVGGRKERS